MGRCVDQGSNLRVSTLTVQREGPDKPLVSYITESDLEERARQVIPSSVLQRHPARQCHNITPDVAVSRSLLEASDQAESDQLL